MEVHIFLIALTVLLTSCVERSVKKNGCYCLNCFYPTQYTRKIIHACYLKYTFLNTSYMQFSIIPIFFFLSPHMYNNDSRSFLSFTYKNERSNYIHICFSFFKGLFKMYWKLIGALNILLHAIVDLADIQRYVRMLMTNT